MGIFSALRNRFERLDDHGQPLVRAFRSEAVIDRQIDELIGIIKGILFDGVVAQEEVEMLCLWLETNRAARDQWPAKVLYPRIAAALADGVMDQEEERELLEMLMATIGNPAAPKHGESSGATSLPVTRPAPQVYFQGHVFCFTGKFFSGTRAWCQDQVKQRGGRVIDSITTELNYLVIGEIGSRDWIHSTHGRKIEKAVSYNETSKAQIAIISEEHWANHLGAPSFT